MISPKHVPLRKQNEKQLTFRPKKALGLLLTVTGIGSAILLSGGILQAQTLISPTIYACSSYYNSGGYVRNASGDNNPYVTFDLGGTCNLATTLIWNLNQAGYTENGANNVRISVSADGVTFTVLGTVTLNQAGGTPTEPSQEFATPATGIRYVKLEPLDGYGGGWNGLGAVRFE